MDIDRLNAEHGIPGSLRFTRGRGDLDMIEITTAQARALISPYGGQILSFQPSGAEHDLLFVSERAYFALGKSIKGGIPICWPWFGVDPEAKGRPAHGFVRAWPWRLVATEMAADGTVEVRLGLADDAATRVLWPHRFELGVRISVGHRLSVALVTRNTGDRAFRITQGLHAYFKVGEASTAEVEGLAGCRYIDKAVGGADAVIVQDGAVRFASEVNRIYEEVPPGLSLLDPTLKRRIRIESEQSRTAVVWNPWIATARAMDDLDNDDYRRFVCVETVNTATEVIEVPPRTSYRLAAHYAIEPL